MKLLFIVLLLGTLLLPLQAFAGLGSDETSISGDQSQMKGSLRVRQAGPYAVHEIHAASGTVVREYVSSAGLVFAVTWQGPFVPNMEQLLGSYFQQYSAGVQATKAAYVGRRPLNLQLPGLVVQMNGYMRSFHFRAYIPQQIPAGAKAEELW
ncbi:MAG: DUF2844 domain-containing protein [Terriglobales bacterium]